MADPRVLTRRATTLAAFNALTSGSYPLDGELLLIEETGDLYHGRGTTTPPELISNVGHGRVTYNTDLETFDFNFD
jgi:hypothetical protein